MSRLLADSSTNVMPEAPITPSTERSIEPIRMTRVAPTPTISGIAAWSRMVRMLQQGQERARVQHREHDDQHDQRAHLAQPLVARTGGGWGRPAGPALGGRSAPDSPWSSPNLLVLSSACRCRGPGRSAPPRPRMVNQRGHGRISSDIRRQDGNFSGPPATSGTGSVSHGPFWTRVSTQPAMSVSYLV